ncbi:VOC family protein [Phytoactinopolyspora halotolerans]|uniref:VOC family protein n=1 Tax=Phytoactinopolyspora halotolerans TaxID=1981512 RepID=A0A6L9S4I4_9ACTN|nr:VOC family protein [Phytoactinopolyspora halotolerans]NED99417.1 VOC family protein [Phytoactinopolyspora halotolerans]
MTAPAFTLCPYRFSDDPPRMINFLTTLGLARTVSSRSESFAILSGRSGRIAVHSSADSAVGAEPGETRLCFETPDGDSARTYLTSLGLDATIVDEAYGRYLHVSDWHDLRVGLNEEMKDFYGYRRHDRPGRAPRVNVVGVWFHVDFAVPETVLRQLGYVPDPPAAAGWQTFRTAEPSGVVGLHTIGAESDPRRSGVGLSFETAEPPENLVERLHTDGHSDARLGSVRGTTIVLVTDPDGQRIEIHRAPR